MSVYRNVITVEILSNEPWGDGITDLAVVEAETSRGGSSGLVTRIVANQELGPAAAAARLQAQGSDPQFLLGDDVCARCYAPLPDSITDRPELCAACAAAPPGAPGADGQPPPASNPATPPLPPPRDDGEDQQPAGEPAWTITVDCDGMPAQVWTPVTDLSPRVLDQIFTLAGGRVRAVRIEREVPVTGTARVAAAARAGDPGGAAGRHVFTVTVTTGEDTPAWQVGAWLEESLNVGGWEVRADEQ